jgi:hypothetical protein
MLCDKVVLIKPAQIFPTLQFINWAQINASVRLAEPQILLLRCFS